jgi:hypothetical protein
MSVSLSELWMAILLAGVLCWVASALIHMLLKYHNLDYKELSNEDEVSAALRASSAAPALYTLPYCSDMKEMGGDVMQKKFTAGPVAMISVFPDGMPNMGKALGLQILFFLIGSVFIAYLATMSMGVGTESMVVFRYVFVAAFVAYGWGQVPYSIWMGQPWSNCVRYLIDALIYGAVTAGTFAWLWPQLA